MAMLMDNIRNIYKFKNMIHWKYTVTYISEINVFNLKNYARIFILTRKF